MFVLSVVKKAIQSYCWGSNRGIYCAKYYGQGGEKMVPGKKNEKWGSGEQNEKEGKRGNEKGESNYDISHSQHIDFIHLCLWDLWERLLSSEPSESLEEECLWRDFFFLDLDLSRLLDDLGWEFECFSGVIMVSDCSWVWDLPGSVLFGCNSTWKECSKI